MKKSIRAPKYIETYFATASLVLESRLLLV